MVESIQFDREREAKQSKAALDASINNFRQEQRAWLGLTEFTIEPDQTFPTGFRVGGGNHGPNTTLVVISNSGRTPAREVVAITGWELIKRSLIDWRQHDRWIRSKISQIERGKLPPTKILPFMLDAFGDNSGNLNESYKTGLPPNAAMSHTERIGLGVIAPNLPIKFVVPGNWFSNTPEATLIVVYGTLKYKIPTGWRTTNFCGFRLANEIVPEKAFSVCPVFNDME